MSLILNSNISRKINHNKCNSMKYIENNSSSFNYDANYNQKFHINHLNNSYRERDKKFEKEKSNEKRDSLKSNKKGVIKKGKIMNLLSFKSILSKSILYMLSLLSNLFKRGDISFV